MSTGFEKRYAGMTREECHHAAMLIMIHAVQTGKWDDVPERLMELRKVMSYAPVPKVECWGADNPKNGPVKEYIWKNPDDLANGLSGVPINKEPFAPKSRIVEHTFEEFMGKEKNGKLNPLTPSGDELVHGDDPILEAFERGQKSRK